MVRLSKKTKELAYPRRMNTAFVMQQRVDPWRGPCPKASVYLYTQGAVSLSKPA